MLRASLLASLLFLPGLAAAQQPPGLSIHLATGASLTDDLLAANATTKMTTAVGPLGVVDFGWTFRNGIRTELEGSVRDNGVDDIYTRRMGGVMLPLSGHSGSLRTYAVMANIIYDLKLQPFGLPLRPYIGGGLGYGWLHFDDVGGRGYGTLPAPFGASATGPTNVGFGSAGAPAYQAIVGTAVPLPILPGLEATFEYRFFGMTRADVPVDRIATSPTNTLNGAVPSASTHNGFEYRNNAMLIGLRYRLWGY